MTEKTHPQLRRSAIHKVAADWLSCQHAELRRSQPRVQCATDTTTTSTRQLSELQAVSVKCQLAAVKCTVSSRTWERNAAQRSQRRSADVSVAQNTRGHESRNSARPQNHQSASTPWIAERLN